MTQKTLTPREMRRIAEHALGMDEEMSLCHFEEGEHPTGKAGWRLLKTSDAHVKPGSLVIAPEPTVQTEPRPWKKPKSVTIVYGSKNETLDLVAKECDAVFWSRSAMEKFVLDYYLPLKPPLEFLALYSRVMGLTNDGTTLYAITHTYPSIETLLTEDTVFLTEKGPVTEERFIGEAMRLFSEQFLPPASA
jgi:hypothetical protein